MWYEDRRQARARIRATDEAGSRLEQVIVLALGAVALLGFLLL